MRPELSSYWGRLVTMLAPGDWLYLNAHYLVGDAIRWPR